MQKMSPDKKSAWVNDTGGQTSQKNKHHENFKFFGGNNHVNRVHNYNPNVDQKPIPAEKSKKTASNDIANYASAKAAKKSNEEQSTSCATKLLTMWADDNSVLRLSWTSLLIAIFTLIFAGIMYAIEKNEKCKRTFWESLWFVNTICSTIGFGYLTPCTVAGQSVTMVIALVGIPLNVIALSDVGKLMARLLSFVWRNLRRCCGKCSGKNKKKTKTSVIVVVNESPETTRSVEAEREVEVSEIPMLLALFVTLLWFTLMIVFFDSTETGQNLTFFDWFYFTITTVTTVGFGDISPQAYNLVVPQFCFITIGIALFSMVINIIQDKVDSLSDNVEDLINKEYAQAQASGENLQGQDERTAREQVKNIVKKQKGGAVLKFMMGKNMEDRLVQDYMEKARKRLVGTQTDNVVHDREIDNVPKMNDQWEGTDETFGVSKGTQLRWMPVTWTGMEYLQPGDSNAAKRKPTGRGK